MPLEPTPPTNKEAPEVVAEPATPRLPGFYVVAAGLYTGPFLTEHDAEAHISGHLEPQGIDAEVEEVVG